MEDYTVTHKPNDNLSLTSYHVPWSSSSAEYLTSCYGCGYSPESAPEHGIFSDDPCQNSIVSSVGSRTARSENCK